MTNPQATEDGEIWPKDTSVPMATTTILAQQMTQAHPQIGMDAGECKNTQRAEEKVTTQETAELNGTMNFGTPGAIETITATTLADYPHADPAHPDTWVTIIHTFFHAQEMITLYHRKNQISPPDPHP